jgi:hypothetical protein
VVNKYRHLSEQDAICNSKTSLVIPDDDGCFLYFCMSTQKISICSYNKHRTVVHILLNNAWNISPIAPLTNLVPVLTERVIIVAINISMKLIMKSVCCVSYTYESIMCYNVVINAIHVLPHERGLHLVRIPTKQLICYIVCEERREKCFWIP